MAARAVPPGRLRRRLTVAFVLVAGVAAAVLAVGSYLMVRQARLDDSVQQAAVDARYQLVLAREFLPLEDERRASLLASFEHSGRHVALVVGWVVVVLLAAGVGHVLARRTLEPVGRASQAARAVAEGLLATRLPVRGRDEFGAWAASFNEMAAALETKIAALSAAQARERRFTADVAHELRTPVTALVAEASLLREHLDRMPEDARRPAELVVQDVARLRRLGEELMEISRLDAGRESLEAGTVDVPALVRSVVGARGWQS